MRKTSQNLAGKIESVGNVFGEAPAAAGAGVTTTVTVTALNEYKDGN